MTTTTPDRPPATTEEPAALPVVVIGAGPIGLAAAANAAERGMPFVVLEAGPEAGAAVGEWAHVRLFSAWRELIDPAARRLLDAAGGWTAPDEDTYPTGGQWRETYLQPLADLLDATAGGTVRYGARVVGVSRAGRDLLVDSGREADPFAVHVETPTGHERLLASAVVDASGTWTQPNPLGADGYPALGERENAGPHHLRHPRLRRPRRRRPLRRQARRRRRQGRLGPGRPHRPGRARRAGRRGPQTRVSWLLRRPSVGDAFGGGDNDQLEERGKLGQQAKAAASSGAGHQRHPVPHRVRHHPGRRPPDHRLGQRPAGHRRRRGHRGDRVPPRLHLPLRGAPGPGPGPGCRARARRPGASRPPQLRRRRTARLPGAGPARAEPLPGRDEVLRPRAVVPGDDRVRAGPLGRGRAGRRPRGRGQGRAGAARDRGVQRRRRLR